MADQLPSKDDLQVVFNRLRSLPPNKVCFDCNSKNPTWATVTYGVFICIDCSAVHRSLGVHLTFVRSTQLDTNWTWLQLRQMQLGGNANAKSFFHQHNCTTNDAQQKYNSRAANLYREKLSQSAMQAMKIHGTKLQLPSRSDAMLLSATQKTPLLHIESAPEAVAVDTKEVDFFEDHVSFDSMLNHPEPVDSSLGASREPQTVAALNRGQPTVDSAISWGDNEPSQERKPTIGGRKPPAKKTGMGLGTKKGGFGATKVKANFAEIEQQAAMADHLKVVAAEEAKLVASRTAEEEEKQMASMRLAYQDLGIQQKKEEEKMKQTDPKKAKQIERLGMGFGARGGVSHSALSDMKTIEQEGSSNQPKSSSFDRHEATEGFFEDFVLISPGMSMSRDKVLETMLFGDGTTSRDRHNTSFGAKASSGGWGEEAAKPSSGGGWGWEEEKKVEKERPAPRREPPPSNASSNVALNNEAQTKFGGAKAISSDQFFGDSSANTWERKANLSRFEGSNSISSADYFNNGVSSPSGGGGGGMNMNTPDLDDVKESVRQGVTKVAGKLSSLANGVMSSIQDRYGY